MVEPITVTYTPGDKHWVIRVSGQDKELTATAPGILASRDRADELVDEIEPDKDSRAVVHLLEGSALEFTTAYLDARMSRTDDAVSSGGTSSTSRESADVEGTSTGEGVDGSGRHRDDGATSTPDDDGPGKLGEEAVEPAGHLSPPRSLPTSGVSRRDNDGPQALAQ